MPRGRAPSARAGATRNAQTREQAFRRLLAERDALAAGVVALTQVLRMAHACATLREDGTCDGCFVSEALEGAPARSFDERDS